LMNVVREICSRDNRYHPQSYIFVLESLDFTAKMLNKPREDGAQRHVTGRELLEGIRRYALQQFGPMALTVLKRWGVEKTDDFGEIVFNLVEAGKLRRTESDRKEDFAEVYDFEEVFARPYVPDSDTPVRVAAKRAPRKPRKPRRRKGDQNE
jgi:uncharacterized repeat protein (TIGR04138 family)